MKNIEAATDLGNSMSLLYISVELEEVALNEKLGAIALGIQSALRTKSTKEAITMLREVNADNPRLLPQHIKPELLNKILTVKI